MLNEGQRRHLSATLRLAEDRLLDLQRQLKDGYPGRLLTIDADLTPAERAIVEANIVDLLQQIADAGQRLGVTPGWQSLRRAVVGTLSVIWADLQDAQSASLNAYGETDPRLPAILDPLIERMADELIELCRILDENERNTTPGG